MIEGTNFRVESLVFQNRHYFHFRYETSLTMLTLRNAKPCMKKRTHLRNSKCKITDKFAVTQIDEKMNCLIIWNFRFVNHIQWLDILICMLLVLYVQHFTAQKVKKSWMENFFFCAVFFPQLLREINIFNQIEQKKITRFLLQIFLKQFYSWRMALRHYEKIILAET